MSTGGLSSFWYFLQFVLPVSKDFYCTTPLLSWLYLFQDIFEVIVNGWLLSQYVFRRATDSCMLILHSAPLLNVFTSSRSFLLKSFGSKYRITSSINKDILTSSFLTCTPFISFSSVIALVRTSNIILNRHRLDILTLFLILVKILCVFSF